MGGMLALLAALAAAATPSVGCDEHVEPSPLEPPAPPRHVVAGPVAMGGGAWRGVGRREGSVSRKTGLIVEHGSPVTLRVLTPRARIIFRRAKFRVERWQDADRVLRVVPCDPDHEAFSSDGTVGAYTGFAGGIIADRRKCVRIRVSRDGRSWVLAVPLGHRCG
jgi:hypothetical protein